MKLLRPISLLACLVMTTAGAAAQTSPAPPGAQPPAPPPAAKQAPPKAKAKAPAAAQKPATTPAPAPTTSPRPTTTTRPAPAPSSATDMPTFDDPNVDNVYAAYQRGLYKTTFDLATTRAQFAR